MATTQPAPQVTASFVRPKMCGTLWRSRTMRSPLRRTFSRVSGPCPFVPSRSDLKKRLRSPGETWSNSGVRPSYICAWSSASGTTGTPPYWPDGMMLSAVRAKSGTAYADGTRTRNAARMAAGTNERCTNPPSVGPRLPWLRGQYTCDLVRRKLG